MATKRIYCHLREADMATKRIYCHLREGNRFRTELLHAEIQKYGGYTHG